MIVANLSLTAPGLSQINAMARKSCGELVTVAQWLPGLGCHIACCCINFTAG